MCGWEYYNHAMVPTTAPHEEPELTAVKNGTVWSSEKKSLLVRWTTDFDCGFETPWWYVIKDTPFDPSLLKGHYRYKLNKGKRYFDVRRIDAEKYLEEILLVQEASFSAYPAQYRPKARMSTVKADAAAWSKDGVYGAFFRDTDELCGYAVIMLHETHANLAIQKTMPEFEKYQINAALVDKILEELADRLDGGNFYICDGERNISHQTAFQDYLEKKFGFRKAYCRLNVLYRPGIGIVIGMLYPFRKLLKVFDRGKLMHKINAVLFQEELHRTCNEIFNKEQDI